MLKKLLIIIVLLVMAVLLYNLGRQIFDSLNAGDRVGIEEHKLAQLKQKNINLQNKLTEVNSLVFLEAQARDKFSLSRPGETIVIIPQSEIDKILEAAKPPPEPKIANWQGWLNLFFK